MKAIFTCVVALLVAVVFNLPLAQAHESQPIYLEIKENGTLVSVSWKTPDIISPALAPAISLQGCGSSLPSSRNAAYSGTSFFECSPDIAGKKLLLTFPSYNPSLSTFVRLVRPEETLIATLPPNVAEWTIPEASQPKNVIAGYLRIGVRHILDGIDHILFIAGLMIIARRPAKIFTTITGFTIAHSLTLFLTVFDVIALPVKAVEAVIALSIVFLAYEIVREDRNSFTWRYPVIAAACFGLLHGMGFAAALSDIGLPPSDKVVALLFFNVGVELGQVLIGGVLFFCGHAIAIGARKIINVAGAAPLQTISGYALGSAASFWFLERLLDAL